MNDVIDQRTAPLVTRLFLIRHGATQANECRPFVLQGCEIDGPLTESGRRQAGALTRFLADIQFAAIYSSPMRRAIETVSEIAASRSLQITTIEELRECHVGRWAGLSWEEIRRQDQEQCERFLLDPANERHPGGESYLDLQRRALPAIDQVLQAHPGQNVLVLAHNMVNRVLLSRYLELDLRHARKIRQANCCINLLQHSEGTTEVVTMNSLWHLDEVDRR